MLLPKDLSRSFGLCIFSYFKFQKSNDEMNWSLLVCNVILLWNSDFKGVILGYFGVSVLTGILFLCRILPKLVQYSTDFFFPLLPSKPTSLTPSSWVRPGKWNVCYSDNLIWDKVLMADNALLLTMPAGFPGGASGKEPTCQCRRLRDMGSVPGSGSSPGGGHGNPL